MTRQSVDEYATDIVEAFRRVLIERMNQAEREKLQEHIEADLKRADVEYIARDALANPTWFPE